MPELCCKIFEILAWVSWVAFIFSSGIDRCINFICCCTMMVLSYLTYVLIRVVDKGDKNV